jgi:hypothetical protein
MRYVSIGLLRRWKRELQRQLLRKVRNLARNLRFRTMNTSRGEDDGQGGGVDDDERRGIDDNQLGITTRWSSKLGKGVRPDVAGWG